MPLPSRLACRTHPVQPKPILLATIHTTNVSLPPTGPPPYFPTRISSSTRSCITDAQSRSTSWEANQDHHTSFNSSSVCTTVCTRAPGYKSRPPTGHGRYGSHLKGCWHRPTPFLLWIHIGDSSLARFDHVARQ